MRAVLHRFADTPFGVFGMLALYKTTGERVAQLVSGEDDWLDNTPQQSCIPAGRYLCQRVDSPKFGDTFEVTGVPNRSKILLHWGNTEEDTEGCILLGTEFGALQKTDEDSGRVQLKWAVIGSRGAFAQFLTALMGVQQFTLEILWSKPGDWRHG